MLDLGTDAYLWIKALHLISVIAWMAGLFYLPRLFVYHTQAEAGSEMSKTFKVMERKLWRAIMNPAMVASVLFGGILLGEIGDAFWVSIWLQIKVACAVAMVAFHFYLGQCRITFAHDRNTKPEKFYRAINEIPTVLMMVIVVMAILRPF